MSNNSLKRLLQFIEELFEPLEELLKPLEELVILKPIDRLLKLHENNIIKLQYLLNPRGQSILL